MIDSVKQSVHTYSRSRKSKSICALMNEEWALLLERIFMTEKNTIMERLFHTLDEKAKSLNEENGQSFIENLGLAMEDIYTNKRDLLEQATLQDRRKAFQFAYLSLMQEENIQANHQITPDSMG